MSTAPIRSVTIVGASLAGHASAKVLRAQGFDGRITIIGSEHHRPYDRPPLSKEFLAGLSSAEDLSLEMEDESLDAEWMLGATAIGLDTVTHTVRIDDGRSVTSDAIVIATGSSAKGLWPDLTPDLPGVHRLRSVDDANVLRSELTAGARLVVVGSGFVGLEVASTAVALGVDTTVLGSSTLPLSNLFGAEVGEAVRAMHESHGTRIRNGVRVSAILGTDRVTGVLLDSGEEVAADVVLLAIGSTAAVQWLAGSGLEITDGVVADEFGATSEPGIYAVGDCSAWFDPVRGRPHRIEHWTDSRDRAAIAMASLLGLDSSARAVRPSYLWSDQCGGRIQFAGRLLGAEQVDIEAGSAATSDLFVVYRRDGEPVAGGGINQPRLVAQWRKKLTSNQGVAA